MGGGRGETTARTLLFSFFNPLIKYAKRRALKCLGIETIQSKSRRFAGFFAPISCFNFLACKGKKADYTYIQMKERKYEKSLPEKEGICNKVCMYSVPGKSQTGGD